MSTAVAPETNSTPAPQFSYKSPPPGFYFDHDEVKGEHGQKSFGQRPLLTVHENEEGVRGLLTFYGPEGVARIYNGTSGRVQAQSIARRVTQKGIKEGWDDAKINEEIAKAQLEYRPGKRQGGASTAESRAVSATKKAAQKVSGDAIAAVLGQIASMDDAQRAAFAKANGLDPSIFAKPAVEPEDEDEDEGNDQDVEGEAGQTG